MAEEIEQDILPSLNDEYERDDVNVDHLITETKEYFQEQYLKQHKSVLEDLIEKGQISEAQKIAQEFKPLSLIATDLNDHIKSVKQIRRKGKVHRTIFMRPWLVAGEITIIYANWGCGKSLIAILVAYLTGLEKYDDPEAEIGEWRVINPTGCLYMDGELGEKEMEQRVAGLEWVGKQSNEHRLRIFSLQQYQSETDDFFDLSKRDNQLKIIQWLTPIIDFWCSIVFQHYFV
jgi:hypothetical protein